MDFLTILTRLADGEAFVGGMESGEDYVMVIDGEEIVLTDDLRQRITSMGIRISEDQFDKLSTPWKASIAPRGRKVLKTLIKNYRYRCADRIMDFETFCKTDNAIIPGDEMSKYFTLPDPAKKHGPPLGLLVFDKPCSRKVVEMHIKRFGLARHEVRDSIDNIIAMMRGYGIICELVLPCEISF
jgi:hypothetical protein